MPDSSRLPSQNDSESLGPVRSTGSRGQKKADREGPWPYRDHHQAHTGMASVWPCLNSIPRALSQPCKEAPPPSCSHQSKGLSQQPWRWGQDQAVSVFWCRKLERMDERKDGWNRERRGGGTVLLASCVPSTGHLTMLGTPLIGQHRSLHLNS